MRPLLLCELCASSVPSVVDFEPKAIPNALAETDAGPAERRRWLGNREEVKQHEPH
jgi:hypothetical protein